MKPGTEYKYAIKVENVVSEDAKKRANKKLKESGLDKDKLNKEDYTYGGEISTLISTPVNKEKSLKKDPIMSEIIGSEKNIKSLSSVPNFFSFTYRTFIPYKSVENKNFLSKHKYLKGDNRSFTKNSNIELRRA
ncbi:MULTISPECIES: hypothetical protein [Clostridia]|uniref:hypothetical protein n=1 Tax=Clostridia TaxID=186801 RepID=UPI000EA13B14|nr:MULTISPECIES: hypothetical protein [Clostridia]NBJ71708.1 hypothetical protein [Roseburia sp. 1XD42-34]RKI73733.1 hypothetical protein D7V87_20055 [Clostridium sp. 1xD42-85]